MDETKRSEKLWDLANLITGFAVAQSIATTFAMSKDDLDIAMRDGAAHVAAFVGVALFTTFYIIAIRWCRRNGSPRDSSPTVTLWHAVTWGRVSAVLLFALVTSVAVAGHWKDVNEGRREKTTKALAGPDGHHVKERVRALRICCLPADLGSLGLGDQAGLDECSGRALHPRL